MWDRPGEDDDEPSLIRPYTLTGGRTRAAAGHDLALETLIVARGGPVDLATLARECRRILELCASPLSVAEVSAHLRVPVGVARVLVGDLAASGLVDVHQSEAAETGGRPAQSLLERVLNGLQAL